MGNCKNHMRPAKKPCNPLLVPENKDENENCFYCGADNQERFHIKFSEPVKSAACS